MSADETFQTLKTFFETRKAASQAMAAVQEGVDIGVSIGETLDCTLFRRGDQPIVERRAAVNPDVVFHIRPETVYILNDKTKDEIGDIGVNVLKEILAGNIKIKVPGRFLNIISRGYLDMIRKGGVPVARYLASHGFANVSKIISTIKKMKR
jgi:hypothetical protein